MAVEDYVSLLPAWIRDNPGILEAWQEGVANVGYDNALEWVQQTPAYDAAFPGNKRDDGSLRMTENEYMSRVDAYHRDLTSVGLNPGIFGDQIVDLIEGDVSPTEFWEERLKPMWDRITERGPDLIARYANDYNLTMTKEALLASALDTRISDLVMSRRISLSEIRAQSDKAFGMEYTDRYENLTQELLELGDFDAVDARSLFQQAKALMPTLSVLAGRHADPDDDFDLTEFAGAVELGDVEQQLRMKRLMAQEDAAFTGGGQIDLARTQSGGVAGLAQR